MPAGSHGRHFNPGSAQHLTPGSTQHLTPGSAQHLTTISALHFAPASARPLTRSLFLPLVLPLLDFLYPALCLSCGCRLAADESLLCSPCARAAPPLTGDDPSLLRAREYHRREWGIDDVAALWQFEGPVRDLVHVMKYGGLWSVAEEAGVWLGRHMEHEAERWLPDVIVPVPLHPARLRERGYNQSARVAQGIARVLGVPVCVDAAARTRNTATQTALDRERRRDNVTGAFRVDRPGAVRSANVLIVDDVVTSGATVGAVAEAFRRAGARGCAAACLAIAPLDPARPPAAAPGSALLAGRNRSGR
jgi:ComF family protein